MHFAVDTETTGIFSPRPIEIACVKIDDFSVSFCERIKPDIPVEPRATLVHNITESDLQSCRSETEVMTAFVHFLQTVASPIVLVAHNAQFDRQVIEHALERSKLAWPCDVSWECTLTMSREKYGRQIKNTLESCCLRHSIPYEDAHSALPDAIMCAKIYKTFFEDPRDEEFALGQAEVFARMKQEDDELQNVLDEQTH
jgi:DNA polymerase III epsilon subunit-like protein